MILVSAPSKVYWLTSWLTLLMEVRFHYQLLDKLHAILFEEKIVAGDQLRQF